MNKRRELYLLFRPDNLLEMWKKHSSLIKSHGYTLIYAHSFPNDEPPYIQVTYYGKGIKGDIYIDDCETIGYYLIRVVDVDKFLLTTKSLQREYCDYYLEGIYTRNAGEHKLSPTEYANGGVSRPPKIKRISSFPNNIPLLCNKRKL